MKKLLAMILVLCCISGCACADFDLSIVSYDDLIALQKVIIAEIMSRPEWKEVTVPAGSWKVGDDIPAGAYSVFAESSTFLSIYGKNQFNLPEMIYLQDGETYGKLILEEGWSVEVNSPVVFAPPKGLGF